MQKTKLQNKKLRLHLRDVTSSESMIVRVSYAGVPHRVDAYVDGQRVAAAADSSR